MFENGGTDLFNVITKIFVTSITQRQCIPTMNRLVILLLVFVGKPRLELIVELCVCLSVRLGLGPCVSCIISYDMISYTFINITERKR